jgi:4-hydroxybenzoate polyprenyltransferase
MDDVIVPSTRALIPFPLVVDLDGTLVQTDLLLESFFVLMRRNPLYLILLPVWLLKGKAYLKEQISLRAKVDVSVLPYNQKLLDHLKIQRAQGRRLVLATASNERMARDLADYLQIFDRTFASSNSINLSGRHKRDLLVREFGEKGFDYAGNSRSDLSVWGSARKAVLVNCSKRVSRAAARTALVETVFDRRKSWLRPYLRALRLHQWLKNLLVFVPLVMAHRFFEVDLLANASLAFVAFGLCASGLYLVNDLLDLSADRHHPNKRRRPFAAGELSPLWALGSLPCLLGFSVFVSLSLPGPFLELLVIYALLNLGYSFSLKKFVLLDVVILAGLYTLRVMAGSAAIDEWPSPWLLAFSTFLFLSLALVKRYAELVTMSAAYGENVRVRGYRVIDKELVASMGSGSGYIAVLVLAIYISSGVAEIHYVRHHLVWFLCPLLLYWISYLWLRAHRGEMHDDPLIFAVKNWVSRLIILVGAIVFALAI